MKILSQDQEAIFNFDNTDVLYINQSSSIIRLENHRGKLRDLVGNFSSNEKAQAVLIQIFQCNAGIYIVPQDEDVEL